MYVYRGLQCWAAELMAPMDAAEVVPPLASGKLAQIAGVLAGGGTTYLKISAPGIGCEIVKASYAFNVLSLERGQDGTVARPWPKGSCIEWDLTGAAVVELVQETIFCEAECRPVYIASGGSLPPGSAGVPYSHTIKLGGTPPFLVGTFSVPAWAVVTVDGGEIRIAGTPASAGAYDFTVQIKNCGVPSDVFRGCAYVDGGPPEEPL